MMTIRERIIWGIIGVLLGIVVMTTAGHCQTLPDAPQPQPTHGKVLDKRFLLTEGSMYGGILFDLAASMHYVGSCAYVEGNPWFAKNGGHGFKSGTYLLVNLPMAGFETTVHVLARRYAHYSKVANWLMDGLVPAMGAPHYYAAGQWINDCH